MNGSWDAYLASPADFAEADDIITNLEKEREPGVKIIERTPHSLIVTVSVYFTAFTSVCLFFFFSTGQIRPLAGQGRMRPSVNNFRSHDFVLDFDDQIHWIWSVTKCNQSSVFSYNLIHSCSFWVEFAITLPPPRGFSSFLATTISAKTFLNSYCYEIQRPFKLTG